MEERDRNTLALLQLVEAGFNSNDIDALDGVISPDVVTHTYDPSVVDRESLKQAFRDVRTAFPDAEAAIEEIAWSGDVIFRRWRVTGTHRGTFRGVSPTGRRLDVTGVDIERFEDGLVVEHWSYTDGLEILRQLGVELG
jgi:steroid delta-isomerase-like uncharacterized protein